MQLLWRESIILGVLSAIGVGTCGWLAYRRSYALFCISLILTLLIIVCLCKQREKLKTAQLIVENAILTTASSDNRDMEWKLLSDKKPVEVIVSGFGVLSGDEAFKFNYDGVHLFSVEISDADMLLNFGTDKWEKSIRLWHGITSLNEIQEIAEELRYETGVSPIITGWNTE
ncbi:MAG: hypothetical protein ACOX4Q_07060 [Syntrophomonadales bacterium]